MDNATTEPKDSRKPRGALRTIRDLLLVTVCVLWLADYIWAVNVRLEVEECRERLDRSGGSLLALGSYVQCLERALR